MTCPNRDGTLGSRGCIFCSSGGSGEFSADKRLGITGQIADAKRRIQSKTNCKKFIAYFQPFTNTYADVEYLKKIYYEAIKPDEIVALSVATRPDCLGDDVLLLLDEINKIKPVWVELVYDKAISDLRKIGVYIITHVILGLPGESREQMIESAVYAAERSDGIKLQLLHVLKGTDLLDDYNKGLFKTLTLDEYVDILCDCIEHIPRDTAIHRITGDGDKKLLVAPMWSADKKRVLNTINREFNKRNIIQGNKY